MDFKHRSKGLASKIAFSEIPMQPSMFNSLSCLAEETSFKKFLEKIDVLDKLILYKDVKYRIGTVRYMPGGVRTMTAWHCGRLNFKMAA